MTWVRRTWATSCQLPASSLRIGLAIGLLLIPTSSLAAQDRLVIRPEPGTPVVAMEVLVAAGPAEETAAKAGLAYLSARTVVAPIQGQMDSLGAHLEIAARKDALTFTLIASPDVWQEASRILLVALFRDPPEQVWMTRQQLAIATELTARAANPADAAVRATDAAVFGASHPYGRSTVGTPETIRRLTMADVDAFLRNFVVSSRAVVALVGPVESASARAHLVGYIDPTTRLPAQQWPRPDPADALVHSDYNSVTTWVSVSYPIPATGDVEAIEFLARVALDQLSFSPSRSTIFNARSEVIPRRAGGEVRFEVVTPPEEAEEWADRVRDVVEEVAERPMQGAVFESRLRRFRGERLQALASPEARASALARQLLVTGQVRPPGGDLDALTIARLQAAARSLGAPTVVLLGPDIN